MKKFLKSSNKGISMLFVLGALIVTAFIANAVIKISTGDRLGGKSYRSSAIARNAAKSGIISSVSKIETPGSSTDAVISLLQKWVDAQTASDLNESDRWLLGNSSDYETLAEQTGFRTKIIAFDPENFNVKLLSEGKGKGGGKAKVLSVYHLEGLEYEQEIPANIPLNAIHVEGDDDFEMDCSLYVHGSAYFGGKIYMYNRGFYIDGDFRMKENNNTTRITRNSTVAGKAYFGGEAELNAPLTLKKAAGFERRMWINGPIIANGSLYSNGNIGVPTTLSDSALTYWTGGFTTADANYYVTSPMPHVASSSKLNILNKLGMSETEPPHVFFNYDLCNNNVHRTVGGGYDNLDITSDQLNTWYTAEKVNGTLFQNKFLVLKIKQPGSQKIFSRSGVLPFAGKVIILIEGNNPANLNEMYESTSDAVTAFWLQKGSINTGHFSNCDYFRGLIYVNSGGLVMRAKNSGTYIKGALYHRTGAKHKFENEDVNSDQLLEFEYDSDVIMDLAGVGVFTDPSATPVSTGKTIKLKEEYSHIITHFISSSQ